jgi:thioredoxin 1
MSKVINVTGDDFTEVVLKSKLPVLVDFWAPWCGPCLSMSPILDELSIETDGKTIIVKVDIQDPKNQNLVRQYEIMSIPDMKLFKDGQVVREFVGTKSKEVLQEEIESYISPGV